MFNAMCLSPQQKIAVSTVTRLDLWNEGVAVHILNVCHCGQK